MTTITLENLGTVNKNEIIISDDKHYDKIVLCFSYKTCVAFDTPKTGLVVRQNDWSTTTGKYLNSLEPDKDKRIDGKTFEERLSKVISKIKVNFN